MKIARASLGLSSLGGFSLVLLLLGCAANQAAIPSAALVQTQVFESATGAHRAALGWLHVEPFAIVFKDGRSPMVVVRVWQERYRGSYAVNNGCSGIGITLKSYTKRDAALWRVGPNAAGRQDCRIRFFGAKGPKGTQALRIRVLH